MQIRPFKLVNASERVWLADTARRLVGEWGTHWLREPRVGSAAVVLPDERGEDSFVRDGSRWVTYRTPGLAGLSFASGPGLMRRHAAMAFGMPDDAGEPATGSPGGLFDEVFDRALDDLARRVFEAAGEPADAAVERQAAGVPAAVWARASGGAIAEVAFGGRPLCLLFEVPVVQGLLAHRPRTVRHRPPLEDPRQFIGAARVRLAVHAGDAELELGVLQSLVPGDVVPLAASIHNPLRVSVEGTAAPVRAYLGRAGDRKAVQLVARHRDGGP